MLGGRICLPFGTKFALRADRALPEQLARPFSCSALRTASPRQSHKLKCEIVCLGTQSAFYAISPGEIRGRQDEGFRRLGHEVTTLIVTDRDHARCHSA